jgi:hypothetical protein
MNLFFFFFKFIYILKMGGVYGALLEIFLFWKFQI